MCGGGGGSRVWNQVDQIERKDCYLKPTMRDLSQTIVNSLSVFCGHFLKFLYEIFLDLHKAYYALYHDRCLITLAAHIVVPRAIHILHSYRYRLTMVVRDRGYYGISFKGFCEVTQDDRYLPIVSTWL